MSSNRGGKREGAGRKPVPIPLKTWSIRIHEEEKPLVRSFLKGIRKVEEIVEDDGK